ncbi:MAG: SpoIVB peptidase [Clostridiales bacterium]|nr:SpoIVB peptidase [Clostridiales bacterium]
MRKLSFFVIGVISCAFFVGSNINNKDITAKAEESPTVYIGGMTAGFTLKSGGVQVVGLSEVKTDNGLRSPSLNAGLRTGDKIIKVNDIAIDSIEMLNKAVEKSKGKEISITLERNNETINISLSPVKDKTSNQYKIGILARDSVSGIGTVTYVDKTNNRFGALGHSVVGENKQELKIAESYIYSCSIVGVSKGVRGKAGELRGMFLNDKTLGKAEKLCHCGIYGTISSDFPTDNLKRTVIDSKSVAPGKAFIYSTINGTQPQRYDIEIVKVDKNNKENKNYVIKITDSALIEQTGGIVQGMSGSPIIQNNKLVGAITHVFVNDPTRGYGIDIETMAKE